MRQSAGTLHSTHSQPAIPHWSIGALLGLALVVVFYTVWSAPSMEQELEQHQASLRPIRQVTMHTAEPLSHVRPRIRDTSDGSPVVQLRPLPWGSTRESHRRNSPKGSSMLEQHDDTNNTGTALIPTGAQTQPPRLLRLGNRATLAPRHYHDESYVSLTRAWNHIMMYVALIVSLVTGGVVGQLALRKWRGWEEARQEDLAAYDLAYTAAYDLAYTTPASEIGYGSFTSDWTGDYFDKFDV